MFLVIFRLKFDALAIVEYRNLIEMAKTFFFNILQWDHFFSKNGTDISPINSFTCFFLLKFKLNMRNSIKKKNCIILKLTFKAKKVRQWLF
mgnify:CR=1 FL=1